MPKCLEYTIQEKAHGHIKECPPILSLFPGIISGGPRKEHPCGEYHSSNNKLVKK
jgi:hypothetical protein